ncbi:MAG: protease inhibitor I42 family protein [Aeromonadaceae bacterium]|nr:protease inhibitor I42 family protein [Aeromonadaceae bacterium]
MRGRYILASLLLAACSGQHTKPLEVTEADNGKQLTLAVDGEFLLHLAANPSTGFAWQWQPALPAAISCKALAFASGNSDADMVGAPGEQQWLCRVSATGSYALGLDYRRSWEKVPPVHRFSLNLTVR